VNTRIRLFCLWVMASALVAGCGPAAPTAAPPPTNTPPPTATATPQPIKETPASTKTPLPTNTSGPDPTPSGRGGGVIAYCYQPVTRGNTKKEIHAINADGSDDVRMIDTDLSLNHHDWSPDAQKLAAVGYASETTWSIYVFDADGSNLTRLTSTSDVWDGDPAWSPDGARIVFTRVYPDQDNREEIWLMNSDGSDQHWIGVEGGSAKWSPDGTRFIYHALKSDNYDIYTCNTDGTDEQQLTSAPSGEIMPVYSPDGSRIAFTRVGDDSSDGVCIMDSDGTNIRRLTDGGAPKWSPDGSLIAFHSGPFGEWEVYIIDSDGTDVRQVTKSPAGITAINPVWRPE
jgi:TolB protein